MQFKTANKINGLKPVSYGMAVESFGSHSSDSFEGHGKTATRDSASESWCAREDLNLQSLRNQILSLACLPFHHARNPAKLRRVPANLKPAFVARDCTRPPVRLVCSHVVFGKIRFERVRSGRAAHGQRLFAVGAKPVGRGKGTAFRPRPKPRE